MKDMLLSLLIVASALLATACVASTDSESAAEETVQRGLAQMSSLGPMTYTDCTDATVIHTTAGCYRRCAVRGLLSGAIIGYTNVDGGDCNQAGPTE